MKSAKYTLLLAVLLIGMGLLVLYGSNPEVSAEPKQIIDTTGLSAVSTAKHKITRFHATESYLDKAYYSDEILECRNSHTVTFIEAGTGEEITLIGCQVEIRSKDYEESMD